MKKILVNTPFHLLCLFALVACNGDTEPSDLNRNLAVTTTITTATIQNKPSVQDVQRLGINLGQWTYWGAEQLGRNILMNPGFEGVIDRSLVRVTHLSRIAFSDDQRWLGRDDGFWSQSTYEVTTGHAAGAQGTLLDSRKKGRHDLPEYIPRSMPSELVEGDIVALTRLADGGPPTHWWFSSPETARFRSDEHQIRPGSPGRRSLLIIPHTGQQASLASHLDTIGDRAGKLKPINGPWLFSIWMRGSEARNATVRISFRRHGSPAFFELNLSPKADWHRVDHHFHAQDQGAVGPLELRLDVTEGEVRFDDIWLGPHDAVFNPLADAAPQSHLAFAPEAVALLQQLRPGYLRDWQGQLGDTLENRLAQPFARRASRYRPGNPFYLYGLEEFLALNQHIGSRPWLIMPTTFTADEARKLGAWLAQRIQQHRFDEVLVEFGNENWNSLFRPAGIQDPLHHGLAADRLFKALRDGAGNHPALRTVINAQHANPDFALTYDRHSREADIVAIAPYLLHRLNKADSSTMLEALFKDDDGRTQKLANGLSNNREVAVYEVNLHTTGGDAPEAIRNALITSPAAGAALAKRLLESMAAGATRQSLYRLTGFDSPLNEGNGLVRLFGITRNLHEPNALRPSGRAMVMLNRAIQSRLHSAELSGPESNRFTVAAFSGKQSWSAALVSESTTTQSLRMQFPDDGRALPTSAVSFAGLPGVFDGSETAYATVPAKWKTIGPRMIEVEVPAYGMVTMLP